MGLDKKKLIIDPPSGWLYGFPKVYDGPKPLKVSTLKLWLADNGYPKDKLAFAVKYIRTWEE